MNVAIAFDEKFIPYAYVMLTSLFENNKHRDITVYMLYQDIPDKALAVFEELEKAYGQSIIAIETNQNSVLENMPLGHQWTVQVYYRLMLQDVLPESVDRILYLDIDVIVDDKLDKLYDMDFEDKYLIVSRDMSEKLSGLVDQQIALLEHHGIAPEEFPYFNSGVMVMNIGKLRQDYSFDFFAKDLAAKKENIAAVDQDLLNDLFFGKVKFVDEYRYDLFAKIACTAGKGYDWVKENAAIIHFAGRKPWSGDALRYSTEKLWWDYAKLTPLYKDLMEKAFFEEMLLGSANKAASEEAEKNNELKQLLLKMNQYINSLEQK